MNKDELKIRRSIIDTISSSPLMQLATSQNNRLRVVNVWFSYDDELNLYFISKKSRLHSKDLRKQPRVAGSIVNPKLTIPGKRVRGVTFQGKAAELPRNQVRDAYSYYRKRYPNITENIRLDGLLSGRSDMAIYKIKPEIYLLFDEITFLEEPLQHLKL